MTLTNPNYIVDTTFSAKNISSPVSVYTWTVATSVKAQIIFGMTVAASGTYIIYVTHQWLGAGSTYIIQPKSQSSLLAGETTPEFVSNVINFKAGDVVNVMVQGLVADTNVSGVIRIVSENSSTLEATDVDTQLSTIHGAGLWTSGTGAGSVTCQYPVTDITTGLPLDGVTVRVSTDFAGLNMIAEAVSNVAGIATFYLNPGTYYFWSVKSGYVFSNPDTEIVP